MSARAWIAVTAVTVLIASTGCATENRPAQPSDAAIITTGLDAPWSIAFHGRTPLVSERDSGRIVEIDADGAQREVATIDGVEPSGEGGLLGIALHDDYLYAYFTAADDNRVDRFPLAGEPGSLALGDAEPVLDRIPSAGNHNGGRIAFGPDGKLYVTTGDAGGPSDAQDRSSLAGKILRVEPDGAVPGDNPFPGSPVYSYGHRNPQGIGWAPDGTMYSSEFGQDTWDELNVIEPGADYGWPEVEGIGGRPGFVDPVQQWPTGDASPSGIAVTADSVYIANLRGERLRRVPRNAPATSTESMVGTHGRLRDVAIAPDGAMWVLTNNTDGRGDPADGDDRIVAVHE
ncbi:PQQ-dependent sugar dehydrogenase [Gordonia zhaorongruii]|uniref:PQQ-dependent sugar dehydrogenase n=1 Tax=Gordonia zhaorongruii TaxID=2597659 RepID=UPI0010457241|nr:PQQ-dependent sugar dehydrogenase [Gordonia zhaorongruii]